MSTHILLWALIGLLVSLGMVLTYLGTQPAPPSGPKKPSALLARARAAGLMLTRIERITASVATVIGLLLAIFTGWVIALPAFPIAVILLPRLLRGTTTSSERLETLVALEEWTRALGGLLATRARMTDALVATLRSTPDQIKAPVERLVARLQANRPVDDALRAFADDLNDPTGDLVASALILGSRQDAAGLREILDGLAGELATEIRIGREVESSRASGRQEARLMTIIAPAAMFGFLAFTSFGQTYATPFGQLVLTLILALFIGCLIWMHLISQAKPEPRFLDTAADRSAS